MQIHYSLESLPPIPHPVVTVGSFDGVHKGHRVIIKRLNSLAAAVKGASVLITFSPHPRKVLYPDTVGKELKMINSLPEKCLLLEEAGLDHLVIMEFTREFATTTSEEFVKDYLLGKLHAHTIVVGFNHFFGYNKEGSYESLYNSRGRLGYQVEEIPPQEIQRETVSSTKIRKALCEGNLQRANAYLEYIYLVQAKTRMHKTACSESGNNCFVFWTEDELKLLPPGGAYAVSYLHNGESHKGVVQITETMNLLFPLESFPSFPLVNLSIRFHKQVEPGLVPQIERVLDRVRELIY